MTPGAGQPVSVHQHLVVDTEKIDYKTFGSSPSLLPRAMPSLTETIYIASMRLLQSLTAIPLAGPPQSSTEFPMTSSTTLVL